MRAIQKLAAAAFIACAAMGSTAQAAPLPQTATVADHASLVEVVQYVGGHRRRAYQGHLRRQAAHYRRQDAHYRRQDAHYRRKAAHYRRAYR
ncbi:hypothetical protein [Methylobacterium sp. CM6244]